MTLRWEDIDFKAGTLRINKSYQRLGGKDVVTSPKTVKSIRTIKLTKQALDALETYKGNLYNPLPSEPVFDWEKRFIEVALSKACVLSSIKKIRVHDLRHSHASLLIELGYSPLLIAQRLGHEKVETTLNTYSHLWPSKESELIEELNSLV